jgi:hypothetical protein
MLARYNPWNDMNAVTRQLDSLFQEMQAPTEANSVRLKCMKPMKQYISN